MSDIEGAGQRHQRFLHDITKVADLSAAPAPGLLRNGLANQIVWARKRDPLTGAPLDTLAGRPSPFNLFPVKHPVSAPGSGGGSITNPNIPQTGTTLRTVSSLPTQPLSGASGGGSGGVGETVARDAGQMERLGIPALVTHTVRAQEPGGRAPYPQAQLTAFTILRNLSMIIAQIEGEGAEQGKVMATGPASDIFRVHDDRACISLLDDHNDPWQVAVQLKDKRFIRRPQGDIEGYALGKRGGPKGGEPVYTPITPAGGSKQAETQIGRGNGPSGTFTPDPNGGGGDGGGDAGGGDTPNRKT